jgi:hypothetical protein
MYELPARGVGAELDREAWSKRQRPGGTYL